MKRLISAAAAALAITVSLAAPAPAHDAERESVTPKFAQPIDNIPGKTMRVVEVNYAPGAASLPHTHAPSAFIYAYVLSGEVESKVNDGEARRYKGGKAGSKRRARFIRSAAMPAPVPPQNCWPCSSSIRTRQNSPLP